MTEPTPQNNPNLDELTRIVLRVIKLETESEKLKADIVSASGFRGLLDALEQRIKILEESRQRQISLNSTFALKATQPKELKEPPKKWKFW